MAGCKSQLSMKYQSKFLVLTFVKLNSLFALENLPL